MDTDVADSPLQAEYIEEKWPPYTFLSLEWPLDLTVELSLLCAGVRVSLFASYKDGQFDPDDIDPNDYLYPKLSYLEQNNNDLKTSIEYERWLVAPVLPELCLLHSQRNKKPDFLLSEHFRPRTLVFRLIEPEAKVTLVAVPYDGTLGNIVEKYYDEIELSDLTAGLERFCDNQSSALLSDLAFYMDSEVIIEYTKEEYAEAHHIPKVVRVIGATRKMAFKPVRHQVTFTEEARTYMQLQHRHPDLTAVRVPPLIGFTFSATTGKINGMLMRFIEGARPMDDMIDHTELPHSPALRAKWRGQIATAVYALHDAGLVWGDVAPKNVLIDSHQDAWVIDFGPGVSQPWTMPEWLDADRRNTVEGDLKGLVRLDMFLRGHLSSNGGPIAGTRYRSPYAPFKEKPYVSFAHEVQVEEGIVHTSA